MEKAQFDQKKIISINDKIKEFLEQRKTLFSDLQEKRASVDVVALAESGSLKAKAEVYENQLVKVNIVKDAATRESVDVLRMLNSAKLVLKISEALFRTGEADSTLREMGFPKLTESLRDAAMYTLKSLNDLRENIAQLEEMMRFIEKYEWILKEDESTMKILLESLGNRPML